MDAVCMKVLKVWNMPAVNQQAQNYGGKTQIYHHHLEFAVTVLYQQAESWRNSSAWSIIWII